jgi:hypothetical protein
MSKNASEELCTELTIGDLKNIVVLINAVKDKNLVSTNDTAILGEISNKITGFLTSINESLLIS